MPALAHNWKEWWDRYKYLMLVVLAGVVLLLLPGGEQAVSRQPVDIQTQEMPFDLEQMEHKLAAALSRIHGAGKVTVVLTLKESSRRILALDTQKEADSSKTTTVVISQGSGAEQSVPVQNIYPKFQGALVVCPGAGMPQVKLELLEAVRALTGLSAERISICKGT